MLGSDLVENDPTPPAMQSSQVVELRAGPLVLAVAPAACGAIARFAHAAGGRTAELLRPATDAVIAARDPLGMGCFPLVPFSNRIRDGRFTFQGRSVTLPPNFPPEPHAIHGHGWRAAWDVVDQDDASLTIEYRHAADAWPFPYRTRQRFSLTDGRLDVEFLVANEGNDSTGPMPVGFGLHPYFVRTPGTRLRVGVERMWKTDTQSMPSELVPVPPEIPLASKGISPDDVSLDANFLGFGGRADIEWPEHDLSLRLEANGPFACCVVYTPPGQPFFCAEPVTNCIDAFNLAAAGRQDTGMLVVAAGQQVSGTVSFIPTMGLGRPAP